MILVRFHRKVLVQFCGLCSKEFMFLREELRAEYWYGMPYQLRQQALQTWVLPLDRSPLSQNSLASQRTLVQFDYVGQRIYWLARSSCTSLLRVLLVRPAAYAAMRNRRLYHIRGKGVVSAQVIGNRHLLSSFWLQKIFDTAYFVCQFWSPNGSVTALMCHWSASWTILCHFFTLYSDRYTSRCAQSDLSAQLMSLLRLT